MSYIPALPAGGYLGWLTLKRTATAQQTTFANQARIKRDEAYFRENIGSITSAEALVADRRLLSVALGAFGLEADINNRYFIRKVLEGGSLDPNALAARLSDKRYLDLSSTFDFADLEIPSTQISDFADKILAKWKERGFEAAVGTVDNSLRLALNAQREIVRIANQDVTEATRWYTVMGQRPLRQVFETAFGLPTAFGLLDVERQKTILTQKAQAVFGDGGVEQFADPAKLENLLRRYLLRAQAAEMPSSLPGSTALSLLTQAAARRRA